MMRKATVTGGAYAVLLAAAVAAMRNFDFLPSGAEAAAFFEERGSMITLGAFLGGVACFCLVWFGAILARRLRSGGSATVASAAFGGSIFAAAVTVLGFVFLVAGAERTVLGGGISPGVAAVLYDLASVSVGNAAPFGLALMTAAVAIAGSEAYPRWFLWVSGAMTIGLVSPFNYAAVALILLWVPTAGIWLERAPRIVEEAA
jgi:hypothetical protein